MAIDTTLEDVAAELHALGYADAAAQRQHGCIYGGLPGGWEYSISSSDGESWGYSLTDPMGLAGADEPTYRGDLCPIGYGPVTIAEAFRAVLLRGVQRVAVVD